MIALNEDLFVLANATNGDLASLCKALWGWKPCTAWIAGRACQVSECACKRAAKLEPFFDYYRNATAYYLPDDVGSTNPALTSHGDLIDIIAALQSSQDRPRSQITEDFFAARAKNGRPVPPESDQNRAFNLAARVITMVQPSAEYQSDGLLEAGMQPAMWRGDESFSNFVRSLFPKREHPALQPRSDVPASARVSVRSVTAKRLKTIAGLNIVPTDDLRRHLSLDESGTVSVYHFTSVLKEHLAAGGRNGSGRERGLGTQEPRGAIPAQLATETLATLKDILFPDDPASQSTLRTLVAKKQFDPDIIRVIDSPLYRAAVGSSISYQYWGSRLLDLHEEIEHPTPRGSLWTWMERKSGSRYVMMATLLGVIIAIVLGVCGLAVSIFQAWVGWQQWQHPIASG
ncbi:hypothetical protein GQ53DRAFT_817076 [Thozetella sp. PMI_491]|nr:hypothetical protein GQ53DRAFT_817076 [Thozetella sp. PMI_491]